VQQPRPRPIESLTVQSIASFSVATIYGPITIPPAPVLVFKRSSTGDMRLAATGSLASVDPDRVVVKRIILSGYPYKIMKCHAVISQMFYQPGTRPHSLLDSRQTTSYMSLCTFSNQTTCGGSNRSS